MRVLVLLISFCIIKNLNNNFLTLKKFFMCAFVICVNKITMLN